MEFNSFSQMFSYIRECSALTLQMISEYMVEEMRKQIEEQVYGRYPDNEWRTGQLGKTPKADTNTDSIEAEFEDSGSWTSLAGANAGGHFFPLYGLEMGKTWGVGGYRPGTEIMETLLQNFEKEIPEQYEEGMRAQGLPIQRMG